MILKLPESRVFTFKLIYLLHGSKTVFTQEKQRVLLLTEDVVSQPSVFTIQDLLCRKLPGFVCMCTAENHRNLNITIQCT